MQKRKRKEKSMKRKKYKTIKAFLSTCHDKSSTRYMYIIILLYNKWVVPQFDSVYYLTSEI